MSNLDSAMAKLDAAALTEGETQAVADFLTAVMTHDDSEEAEVSGFGFEPEPKGFLLEVSGIMKPATVGFSFGMERESFTATDDLARVKGFTDAGRVT